MTSMNRMAVARTVATVRRRASSVVINTPAPEQNVTPTIRFNEEEQIVDSHGVRYADSNTSLSDFCDGDRVFTLYDTSNASYVDTTDLGDMTVEDFLALDNNDSVTQADLPEIGTFTYQNLADILFSVYVALAEDRANPPPEPEPTPSPEDASDAVTEPAE